MAGVPVLFFKTMSAMHTAPNIIALPLTSSIKKSGQPTHVIVKSADSGLRLDSMVLCENPECMSKERIGQYITTLSNRYMRQIAAANLLATSAISFLDTEVLLAVWHKAIRLNAAVPA